MGLRSYIPGAKNMANGLRNKITLEINHIKKALVSGIAGQDGSFLAEFFLRNG
jgi:hypothetical protein